MRYISLITILSVLLFCSGCRKIDGFEQHLKDAISIYQERTLQYGAITGNRSKGIFNHLIIAEKMLLPVARFYDFRAIPFIDKGIPIILNDFVSMEGNKGFEYPFSPSSPITSTMEESAQATIDELLSVEKSNLMSIALASFIALNEIKQLEETNNDHFSMTKHLLESLGFGSLHAIYYQCQSNGETHRLASDFAKSQLLAVRIGGSIGLDRKANIYHQEGIGILVNDLPEIPFIEEYQAFQLENNGQFDSCLAGT